MRVLGSRITASLIAVAAISACVTPFAFAARPATKAERQLLVAAAHRSPFLPPAREWAVDKIAFTNLRISTVDHRWATGTGHLWVGSGHKYDDAATLLFRFHGGMWRLTDIGTSDVGCQAPAAVVKDLGGGALTCLR